MKATGRRGCASLDRGGSSHNDYGLASAVVSSFVSATSPNTSAPPAAKPGRLWLSLKIAITLAAFGYLLSRIDLGAVGRAMLRVPWQNLVIALLIGFFGTALAAVRWGILLSACGATRPPRPRQLMRLMLIAVFYNNYAPGAVGGDIVRGYAVASSFESNGLVRALSVSFLDRLMGLVGLLLLTAAAFAYAPLPQVEGLFLWVGLAFGVAALAVVALVLAPRAAQLLPPPLSRVMGQLPEVRSVSGLVTAIGLSVGTQAAAVGMGYALIAPLAPEQVTLQLSFVVLPVATAAAYFPLTIAGAGAREAAFVALFSLVDVAQSASLAAALLLGVCTLLIGGAGGIVNLVTPLRSELAASL